MTFDEVDGYVLFFGGYGSTSTHNDTWKFVNGVWAQLHPTVSPPPRDSASIGFDQGDGYVVLYGGMRQNSHLMNDTWTYVGGTWTNVTSRYGPEALDHAAMTYDYADGYILLFGGFNTSSGELSDTWTFSDGAWSRGALSGPSGRDSEQMVYDSEDGYVLLFSGEQASSTSYADTWSYSAGVWLNITSTAGPSPAGRVGGGMVDDTYDGYVLLFGGINGSTSHQYSDTWSFVNGVWTQLNPIMAPAAQYGFAMAFDPVDNEAVLQPNGATTTWTY